MNYCCLFIAVYISECDAISFSSDAFLRFAVISS